MKKIYLFLIGILYCFPLWSETIHVSTPGDLREALMDADFNGTQLKITGTLNGADLAIIHAADGRLKNVTELDLSEVNFKASDDCYATYRTDVFDGYLEYSSFYYSETCKRDSSHYTTMLGTGVTKIAVYGNNLAGLFAGNETYKNIVLPKSLNKIGFAMFDGSAIPNVSLPPALTEIEEKAFSGAKLSEVTLPASCKTIGDEAFDCSNLTSINLEHVTKLGQSSFYSTKLQGDIKLGELTEVPDYCFGGCALSSVTFQKGLKKIGIYAFNKCQMKSVSLPEGLEYIGSYAFNSSSLQSVDVPSSINYVGREAFNKNCYTSFELVDGIYYIGHSAYDVANDISPQTSLKFREGTIGISENFYTLTDQQKEMIVSLVMPSSVRMIGDSEYSLFYSKRGTFQSYENLETVILPDGLQTIEERTFEGCKLLKSINIPNSLKKIGERAFWHCESLKNVTLPQGLQHIGPSAFEYSGITSINLGENISYIGYDAFDNCTSLLSMRIDMPDWESPYLEGTPVEKIVFGPKVSNIGYKFMSESTSLIKVIFEEDENITTPLVIGERAFYKCSNLKIPSLPHRLAKVGDDAFYGIKEITSLYLGQNITKIDGSSAFADIKQIGEVYYDVDAECFDGSGINKITIGTHVTGLGNSFDNNSKLTTVIFESRKGIKDPQKLEISSFNNCGITKIVFPEYDKDLPRELSLWVRGGFNNNPIKELKMPDAINTLFENSFRNCQLEKVYLGDNTYCISDSSFVGNKLKWLDIPPSVYYVDGIDAENLFAHNSFKTPRNDGKKYKNNILCPTKCKKDFEDLIDKDVAHIIGYDLKFQESSLEMKVGEKQQLHPIFTTEEDLPSLPAIKYAWMSSMPEEVSIDENGIVTALKKSSRYAHIFADVSYLPRRIYHSYVDVWVDESTGIDNVQSNGSDIKVKAQHGEIVISGAKDNSKVRIYSLDGQNVRTTQEKSIAGLASGIYIVAVENQKFKVMLP